MPNNILKLKEIKNALNLKFYEREREVEAMLIALLARQHMLLIGPSGTAKSALAVEFAKIVKRTKYFQWQLTRFSTPEEIFGPLSLKGLEQGVYKRNTETKMPEADIVFLDEVFKANSAILNSLLTVMNERLFYNAGTPTNVPLMSVIGASNEYPEEGEGLDALFDRFLLRYEVDYIKDGDNFLMMLTRDRQSDDEPMMTIEELYCLQRMVEDVTIPEEVFVALLNIRQELCDEGILPSDRRFKHSLGILKAKALMDNRQTVQVEDLSILENVLWVTIDDKEATSIIIRRYAEDFVIRKLDAIHEEAIELFNIVIQKHCTNTGLEASQKLKSLITDLIKLKETNHHREKEIEILLSKVKSIQEEILSFLLEPHYFDAAAKMRKNKREISSIYYNS
ncbi:AAA family ATPase [Sporosarcina sp. Sa2YVA2]|uniref:AAA family ATPase n=1 Tax=Sporosarcina quadrami TaxID=2762234 RepID=A0ABR8U5L9_9BACL|nr:AAA family ATPase [Sporosarcina quadrami]MBD7983336.1 AAA family ATPase [Sporosarcina quadrami]